MEQLNQALNANLNLFVVASLFLLAIALIMLVAATLTLVPQVHRTLTAYERLASTVEAELEPTLMEANKLMGGLLKLQDFAQHGVSDMTTKVEDVTGNLGKITHEAKRKTSIWQAGLFAGVKAYMQAKNEHTGKSDKFEDVVEVKHATAARGKENV